MVEEAQAVQSSSEDVGEDFYEEIEAPKFVDFSVSDPCLTADDRYWFCSRVGCEEQHPEEMDSEVVYKNFVMRVMAARSPNVRLQRARRNVKCPLTAPPKSSKSRVSRLALISSISKRIVDLRVKSRPPLTKPGATPKAKTKQTLAKAMTTPRNKKLQNPTAFLSVKNPKTTLAEEPKTTSVAKALVFQSPKKDGKSKTSVETKTPVKTLCAGMKKLEIASAKKNVLGDGQPLPLNVPRKKFRGREVKSRVFDSLGTHGCKRQDSKSTRVLKRRSKEKKLKPLNDHVSHETVDEDASDMDIDEKSRHVSMQEGSLSSSAKSNDENQDEELSRFVEPVQNGDTNNLSKHSEGNETSISSSDEKNSEESDFEVVLFEVEDEKNQESNHEERVKTGALEMNISEIMESDDKENVAKSNESNREEKVSKIVEPLNESTDNLSKNSKNDENSMSSSEEKDSEASDVIAVLCEVEVEKNQECNGKEIMKPGEIQTNISEFDCDNKENVVASVNKENAVASDDDKNGSEITENDEAENVPPNDNREDNSYDQSERVLFGKHKKSINTTKVKGVSKKTVKGNSTTVALVTHGLKSSRPKSTNPKPFRLRTDERGVLREANLGKKLNCPLKDITASRRVHGDKLPRKKQDMKQNCESENHVDEERMPGNKTPDDRQGGTVSASSSNNRKGDSGPQNCIDLKHQKQQNLVGCQLEPGREKATEETEDKLKGTKFEKIQQKVRKPRRDVSSKEDTTSLVPARQLNARKETSLKKKILSCKDSTKPSEAALSRRRRPITIPKDPNLHTKGPITIPKDPNLHTKGPKSSYQSSTKESYSRKLA